MGSVPTAGVAAADVVDDNDADSTAERDGIMGDEWERRLRRSSK